MEGIVVSSVHHGNAKTYLSTPMLLVTIELHFQYILWTSHVRYISETDGDQSAPFALKCVPTVEIVTVKKNLSACVSVGYVLFCLSIHVSKCTRSAQFVHVSCFESCFCHAVSLLSWFFKFPRVSCEQVLLSFHVSVSAFAFKSHLA